jgi:DNA-binding CsgD family transcriptional regulator
MRAGDEENGSRSRVGLVSDPLYRPEPTLCGLGASSIGVAVFNRKIRYCAINHTLASFDRVPAEAHLGKPLDPIIGNLANVVGERIERVLHTGQAVTGFEVSGKLPRRPDIGYWLADYLPIFDESGRISNVCVVVVELTNQKRVEQLLRDCRTKTHQRLTFMLRVAQSGVNQCLHSAAHRRTRQIDIDQNLKAFRRLTKGFQEILAEITAVDPARELRKPEGGVHPSMLAPRQRTVLQLLAEGKSPKEIASLLSLTPNTVRIHKARIFKKLGVDSVPALVRYAIKTGLVDL